MNIGDILNRFRRVRGQHGTSTGRSGQETALRSELFSADQMEQHGRTLAARHRPSEHSSANLLLNRLADNEALLTHAGERLTGASRQHQRITPAAEWLLDNFYLIEEQIRIARRHLPRGYSHELPRLDGPAARVRPGAGSHRAW